MKLWIRLAILSSIPFIATWALCYTIYLGIYLRIYDDESAAVRFIGQLSEIVNYIERHWN